MKNKQQSRIMLACEESQNRMDSYTPEQRAELEKKAREIIARAQDPKVGDTYTNGDNRVTVASVSDGVVRYQYQHRYGVRDLEVRVEDWPSLVRKSIEGGAEVSFA